ncbi:MAG: glycosyltransferase family 2 protein [Candidatus Omnitrophica bacterium]|nr:glycosyltransferase family 2 protein [Candidatus Omnitrophota bacterium]
MLSVVILTCNSRKHIATCLDAVLVQSAPDSEVIVVDNGSTDGTKELVRDRGARVRLIENPVNRGASGARNQGIENSSGEWVLTLDCDVVLGEGFLERFREASESLSVDTGMVQPCVLDWDGRTVYSQGIYLSRLRRFFDLNRGKHTCVSPDAGRKIIGPCSAAAFYRRSMLEALKERTGYFDERFFFLVEDADLAWRAKRAGWKVAYFAACVCFHAGNSSSTDPKLRQYLSWRNRRWMVAKNEGFWGKWALVVIAFPYELTRMLWMTITNPCFRAGSRK